MFIYDYVYNRIYGSFAYLKRERRNVFQVKKKSKKYRNVDWITFSDLQASDSLMKVYQTTKWAKQFQQYGVVYSKPDGQVLYSFLRK